ncbi:MAG: hypothetical protein ACJ763_07100 [Bdellovibrionia bacterium]
MYFKLNAKSLGYRGLYKSLGILLVIGLLLIAYPEWKISKAKKLTEQLCAAAPVGGSSDGIEEKARELGLRTSVGASTEEKKLPGEMTIMAWEGFVFGRYYCTINYANGKVTKSWVAFVD